MRPNPTSIQTNQRRWSIGGAEVAGERKTAAANRQESLPKTRDLLFNQVCGGNWFEHNVFNTLPPEADDIAKVGAPRDDNDLSGEYPGLVHSVDEIKPILVQQQDIQQQIVRPMSSTNIEGILNIVGDMDCKALLGEETC